MIIPTYLLPDLVLLFHGYGVPVVPHQVVLEGLQLPAHGTLRHPPRDERTTIQDECR